MPLEPITLRSRFSGELSGTTLRMSYPRRMSLWQFSQAMTLANFSLAFFLWQMSLWRKVSGRSLRWFFLSGNNSQATTLRHFVFSGNNSQATTLRHFVFSGNNSQANVFGIYSIFSGNGSQATLAGKWLWAAKRISGRSVRHRLLAILSGTFLGFEVEIV